MVEQCESYLRQRKINSSLYVGMDPIMPLYVVPGLALQVDPKRDVKKHFREAYWNNNTFLQWVFRAEQEVMTKPI